MHGRVDEDDDACADNNDDEDDDAVPTPALAVPTPALAVPTPDDDGAEKVSDEVAAAEDEEEVRHC
jgi:hypothetical protein